MSLSNAFSFSYYRSLTRWLLALCCWAVPSAGAMAQQVAEQWAARAAGLNLPPFFSGKAVALAVDNAGNSYVTAPTAAGTVTLKYSPGGQVLWQTGTSGHTPVAIAVDRAGGVYVAATSTGSFPRFMVTMRFDAATGGLSWSRGRNNSSNYEDARAIAVDQAGGVYVAGDNSLDYITVRYDAATGAESWASIYGSTLAGSVRVDVARAIAVDPTGGVYVTGSSSIIRSSYYATVRYDAATGAQTWAQLFNPGDSYNGVPAAIATDTRGGIYVTGTGNIPNPDGTNNSLGNRFGTVSYDAATGAQRWASAYGTPALSGVARDLAVDNSGGVYVTGGLFGGGQESYATIRYDAGTGAQSWLSTYSGPDAGPDRAKAVAVDQAGGVYVTGTSSRGGTTEYAILRYRTSDGATTWTQLKPGAANDAQALGIDGNRNLWVTGSSLTAPGSYDILTVKYTQSQCLPLTAQAIAGAATAAVGTSASVYTLAGSGARSFQWSISGNRPVAFSGQGTDRISVDWAAAGVYKISVAYGSGPSCAARSSEQYVAVYDLGAGFVTGNGSVASPLVAGYEYMSEAGPATFECTAKFAARSPAVAGSTSLRLGRAFVFTSTAYTAARLVVDNEQVNYTGVGTVAYYRGNRLVTDPRSFGFLVAASDGGRGRAATGPDKFRLRVWVRNADGSPGAVVYDNQAGCAGASLDDNAAACGVVGEGNVVIHGAGGNGNGNAGREAAPLTGRLAAFPTIVSEQATVTFVAEQRGAYTLACYDARGTLVRTLPGGEAASGERLQTAFNAAGLKNGLYTIRLRTGNHAQSIRVIINR